MVFVLVRTLVLGLLKFQNQVLVGRAAWVQEKVEVVLGIAWGEDAALVAE